MMASPESMPRVSTFLGHLLKSLRIRLCGTCNFRCMEVVWGGVRHYLAPTLPHCGRLRASFHHKFEVQPTTVEVFASLRESRLRIRDILSYFALMDVGPTFYWEFPYFGMATGLPVLFCKTVVPVLDSAVLIRPAGTGNSGLRLCGARYLEGRGCSRSVCRPITPFDSLEPLRMTHPTRR